MIRSGRRWEVCLRERSEMRYCILYTVVSHDREVRESISEERTSRFTVILSPRISLLRVANDIPLFDEATLTNYS
jgi:hypothetical protein